MATQSSKTPSVQLRAAKLRNPRLLQATQPKSPDFERDEPDTA